MSDKLIHRTVDGWDLCSRDGGAWWVRDVELAERAALAKPTDIRRTIKSCIDDGALRPCSDVARGARDVDSAEFVATEVLLPLVRGGHRTATEYLLNKKASVIVAMRLRTERAAELVDAVVTVFLRVVDGSLAGEELRALREDRAALGAELALMKTEMVKLSSKVLDVENTLLLGSGMVSREQRGQIRSAKARAARVYVEAGFSINLRSALRTLQNGVSNVTGWGGAGQRDALLPVDLFTRVLAHLEGETNKAARFLKRRAQQDLPGIENVVPIKSKRGPR